MGGNFCRGRNNAGALCRTRELEAITPSKFGDIESGIATRFQTRELIQHQHDHLKHDRTILIVVPQACHSKHARSEVTQRQLCPFSDVGSTDCL